MPTLVLYFPPKEKRWSVEVPGPRFLIGRNRDAEVCVPHPSVSKKHVLVQKKGEHYVYRDLGSKNGIFLNGFRVDQGALDDGDELRVGSLVITFYEQKPPAPSPAPSPPAGLESDEARAAPEGNSPPLSLADLEKELEQVKGAFVGSSTIRIPIEQTLLPLDEMSPQEESGPSAAHENAPRAREPTPAQAAEDRRCAIPAFAPAPKSPRRLSATVLVLGAAGCVVLGILLGYIGGRADLSRNQGAEAGSVASLEDAKPATQIQEDRSRAVALAPPEPLGPPASLNDPETVHRLCVRLYLDLVGRPPLRRELKGILSLPHEKLWYEISSKAPPAPDPPPEKLGETFERLMGRKPTPDEHAKLREAAHDDPAHYAFEIGTSSVYSSAAHRRKRSETQLARSLLVDLTGVTPGQDIEKKTLDAVRLAKERIGSVAKAIVDAAGESEIGPLKDETPEEWIRDAYARLLLRFPTDSEAKKAASKVKENRRGWRAVLQELASSPEYLQY